MKNLSLIAAIGKNNELGANGQLLWHLKGDLQFFKEVTTGHTIIMGRKTFESLPKLLPNRKHIIITNNKNYKQEGAIIMHSKEEVLNYVKNTKEECFIIGGGSIYKDFIDECYKLYITEVDYKGEADTVFPKINKKLYKRKVLSTKKEEEYKYKHILYTKKRGKLIVIEGTDCSGKETQSKLLVEKLKKDNILIERLYNPWYETPTGKIIGACLLGKPEMCKELLKEEKGFFQEGGGNVDALTACCYYAADRRYNLPKIKELLENGINVIIDRYVISNMAHRGGMIEEETERLKMYKKIYTLEFNILELPKPDEVIFLYLPYKYACELKKQRGEKPDETEQNEKYLINGERAYLELSKIYNYDIIKCSKDNSIRTIEDINSELYKIVYKLLK